MFVTAPVPNVHPSFCPWVHSLCPIHHACRKYFGEEQWTIPVLLFEKMYTNITIDIINPKMPCCARIEYWTDFIILKPPSHKQVGTLINGRWSVFETIVFT
jgi:hypothetical protein